MTHTPSHLAGPSAVLWDMDGTLIDTEPYWLSAETGLVESFGGAWTYEDGLQLVGSGLWDAAAILQDHGVTLDAATIIDRLTKSVQEQLAENGVPWRPGARELLADLRNAGVRTALVTMSFERMARQVAELIDFPAFDVIVAGDHVTHSKPHPEAYLTAADALGVDPRDCVAIEDSAPGIAAAVASGAVALGVPHQIPLPESAQYTLWPTLAGRTADDITALFGARHDAAHQDNTVHDDALHRKGPQA